MRCYSGSFRTFYRGTVVNKYSSLALSSQTLSCYVSKGSTSELSQETTAYKEGTRFFEKRSAAYPHPTRRVLRATSLPLSPSLPSKPEWSGPIITTEGLDEDGVRVEDILVSTDRLIRAPEIPIARKSLGTMLILDAFQGHFAL